MTAVFIDGESGTTGLRLRDRLSACEDVSLISLPHELRRDPSARADAMCRADVTVLCLPDQAAREAADIALRAGARHRRLERPPHGARLDVRNARTDVRARPGNRFGAARLRAGLSCDRLHSSDGAARQSRTHSGGCLPVRHIGHRVFRRRQDHDRALRRSGKTPGRRAQRTDLLRLRAGPQASAGNAGRRRSFSRSSETSEPACW